MRNKKCSENGENCNTCRRWFYSDIVRDHMFNPRNTFKDREESDNYDADGVGEVGSPACGDMMKFMIKVDENTNRIVDCKWQTYGCGTAIASTSIFSEMIMQNKGLTINEALKITSKDIAEKLGGVPPQKFHCSILATRAFKEAVNDYLKKKNK